MSRLAASLTLLPLRLLALAGAVGLGLVILWAVNTGEFARAGAWLISDPWGLVTLTDLYLGFAISAGFILAIERDWRTAALWILPIPVLGNVWTALWICVRVGQIRRRLGIGAARETGFSAAE